MRGLTLAVLGIVAGCGAAPLAAHDADGRAHALRVVDAVSCGHCGDVQVYVGLQLDDERILRVEIPYAEARPGARRVARDAVRVRSGDDAAAGTLEIRVIERGRLEATIDAVFDDGNRVVGELRTDLTWTAGYD